MRERRRECGNFRRVARRAGALQDHAGGAGYEPAIQDTGVRVRAIVEYHRLYTGELSEIRRAIPRISLEQIQAALAYYRDHRGEIDFYIAENDVEYWQAISQGEEQRRAPKKQ